MRMFLVALVVAVVALPSAVPAADKKDEDAIQGKWKIEKVEDAVEKAPAGREAVAFIFKDGKRTIQYGNGNTKESEYKLDLTAKPKAINFVRGNYTSPGIYELEGDTLRICFVEGVDPVRPTEFKPKGRNQVVITFKRVTDK